LVDPESVRRRIREMTRRVEILERLRTHGRKGLLGDPDLQAQVERHLQLALQAAIDVATHLVAEDTAETPEEYGATFVLLVGAGVLDKDLAERLRSSAGLRNVLVHMYLEVDLERIWNALEQLGDLTRFAEAVEAYVTRGG